MIPKKIVLLIDTIAYAGGAERQFVGLAVALKQKGYKVKVLVYYDTGWYTEFLNNAGVEFKVLTHAGSQISKFKAILKQMKKEDPDVVISYKDTPNIIACLMKCIGAKWRLIVSDRNTLQDISLITRFQYGLLYKFTDYIVPNSYSQKNFISRKFPQLLSKIRVITNFTDTETFKPIQPHIAKGKSEKKVVLVVARISEQKNVITFIEAVRLLFNKWNENVKIVWYGPINQLDGDYVKKCLQKIKEYGLEDFFEFRKPVSNIADIYRVADIFCLPSLWEGFPNSLCEAMSSGLAVCASDVCDNRNIITDGKNGLLFNPNSAKDIADKIDKLLSMDPNEISCYVSNARKFAIENLSTETFVKKYIELIEK